MLLLCPSRSDAQSLSLVDTVIILKSSGDGGQLEGRDELEHLN